MKRIVLPGLVGVVVAVAVFLVASAARDGSRATPASATASGDGRVVFAAMGCGSCHRLAAVGSNGEVGPSLDERLAAHTRASLKAVITRPPSGSPMPEDFGTRMSPTQLDALVTFLLATRAG